MRESFLHLEPKGAKKYFRYKKYFLGTKSTF